MHIRIGTRGSDLALWQAYFVKNSLEKLGNSVSITIIKTQGDKIQDLSFDKLEGKGFFTKEIEIALLSKEVDLAVHSHKDLETTPPSGLIIAAVSDREDPAELLLIKKVKLDENQTWQLSHGSVIGTSSARRKAMVTAHRPDLEIRELRGNVPTRIQKLRNGEYDAIILAKAGVHRLEMDLSDFHVVELDPKEFVPAPAQGVLALQIRDKEKELFQEIQKLNNSSVEKQIAIERKILNLMDGGCQLPLGVYCDHKQVFVSYTFQWQNGSKNFQFEYSDDSNLAEEIVSFLKTNE